MAVKAKKAETTTKKPKSNMSVLVVSLVIVGLLLVINAFAWDYAFNKIREKGIENTLSDSIEKATGVKVDISPDSSSLTTTGQKLPTDFPSIVPKYPGQIVTGSFKAKTNEGETNWTATANSKDEYSKVADYFKAKLGSWENYSEFEVSGTTTISATKGNLTVVMNIMPVTDPSSSNKSIIAFTVTQKP